MVGSIRRDDFYTNSKFHEYLAFGEMIRSYLLSNEHRHKCYLNQFASIRNTYKMEYRLRNFNVITERFEVE